MKNGKPKIACLTSFYEFNSSYSLCSVVESQLKSLVKYGYETVLLVHNNFTDSDKVPEGVEIRKVVPRFELVDYSNNKDVEPGFDDQVKKTLDCFNKHLNDIDIVIEHDMIFQGWFLPYCVAIHEYAKTSKIKWFHWIHSVPNNMPKGLKAPLSLRYQLPANSKLVYLNNYNIMRASESYSIWPKDVRIIYNPVDPRLFWDLDPFVEKLVDKYPILEADLVQVYPVSSTRMVDGKQIYTVIDIFAALKKEGKKVCLIICNAHANADKEKETVQKAIDYALDKGLGRHEIVFTSFEGKEYEQGVPRKVVSQLFQLSNLFIFPTKSENCPLILLEAMLSKCILILNQSLPCLREFGKENALYFNFGSLDQDVNYDDRDNFMNDMANIIISELSVNKALKGSTLIRQKFNYDFIFKNMIQPLFSEQD